MGALSLMSFTISKPQIFASALPNSQQNQPNSKPTFNSEFHELKPKTQKQSKPSIAEIERAIGAGIFRDRDTRREAEQKNSVLESIFSNSIGETEGDVEKRLRETGEWVIDKTERASRSAGKQILTTTFLWILPMWIFAFLVASGIIKLPFSTPFLEDVLY